MPPDIRSGILPMMARESFLAKPWRPRPRRQSTSKSLAVFSPNGASSCSYSMLLLILMPGPINSRLPMQRSRMAAISFQHPTSILTIRTSCSFAGSVRSAVMNLRAISTSRYAAHPRAEPRAIFKNLARSVLENLPVLFSNVERNAGGSAIQPIFSGGLCANLSYEVANPSTKGNAS